MPCLRSLALPAALVVLACSPRSTPTPLPRNLQIDRHPTLVQFSSCPDLEQYIEDGLVLHMRSLLEQNRLGGGGAVVGGPTAGAPVPAAAGPAEYTTTNSQVEGVGEADFVQNDGTRIAVVADGSLHLVRSWPPEALDQAASVPIEGWAHDLFLAGDRAVVFSAIQVTPAGAGPLVPCPLMGCGWEMGTKITTFDVSNLAAPALVAEVYLPGRYVSARLVQDRVRLVTSDIILFPEGVLFWPPELAWDASERERDRAFAALAEQNEAIIRAQSLDDWLSRGTLSRPGQANVELAYACTDFSRGSGPTLPGILTVATLDLATSSVVSRTSVLADGSVVYASPGTLYVAAPHWWWWPEPGQRDATYVHAFDLGDPDRAAYVGSGVVDGTIRDQYALDEHGGALRAFTTVHERVDDGTPWGNIETSGRLSVLVRDGASLALAGETAPFGAGESMFGTRFLGTRGFAITARQVDPLFTFDLSDPAHPTVVGELEMPGFIAYLHPIDDTHLLGVGRELSATGGPVQLKVALLDVADLAHPVDVSTILVGEGWSWSEALWDPKAFTWLGARSLLAIPFVDWSTAGALCPTCGLISDLRLFRVDAATGITPAGVLSMADVYAGDPTSYGWWWSPYVRRSILADNFVYAISDAGIRSADVAQLPAWLATIEFAPSATP